MKASQVPYKPHPQLNWNLYSTILDLYSDHQLMQTYFCPNTWAGWQSGSDPGVTEESQQREVIQRPFTEISIYCGNENNGQVGDWLASRYLTWFRLRGI